MMNREQFLQQLEKALAAAPADERDAALQYYTMYFADAGPDAEQKVIAELGSPQKVAQDILSGAGINGEAAQAKEEKEAKGTGEAAKGPAAGAKLPQTQGPALTLHPTLPGAYQNTGAAPPPPPAASAYGAAPGYAPPQPQPATAPKQDNTSKIVLIVVLAVVLAPLWASLLGALISLVFAAITLLAVPVIVGVSLCAAGIGVFIAGLYMMPFTMPHALFMLGMAVLIFGVGLLATYAGCALLGKVVPALFKGIASMFHSIFGKRRAAA